MKRQSTRQQLAKIPNQLGLYRHKTNGIYYGIKKVAGKRKECSLQTTDRKIADRKLKDWFNELERTDISLEGTTLSELILRFEQTRQGKSKSTQSTESGIIKSLKAFLGKDVNLKVSKIRPSSLDAWLASVEPNIKNTTFNRYALLLKQLFELAENDRIISESPHARMQKTWKKPEKPIRLIPTDEQFDNIVTHIRGQFFNQEAEQSANFIEFLGRAGIGQAEASSLTWGDVKWDKGVSGEIFVRRRKTRALFSFPIYPQLRPLIERMRDKDPNSGNPTSKLFTMSDGKKCLSNACLRLKYPHFTQRSLRAYLISHLWKSGIDAKCIAKWQGHTDGGKLILNTYTEVFGENDQSYVENQLAKLKKP